MKTISKVSPGDPLADAFAQLWADASGGAESPPDLFAFFDSHRAGSLADVAAAIRVDQKFRSGTPHQLKVEEYLKRFPLIAGDDDLKADLVVQEFALARRQRCGATIADLFQRFPEVHELVIDRLRGSGFAADLRAEFEVTKVLDNQPGAVSYCENGGADDPAHLPEYIGRYRVIRMLGSGGFGRVYLASDPLLKRPVAIKVPKDDLVLTVAAREKFLSEARMLASLQDSANVVPVYDVGITARGVAYVVSRFVDGSDLSAVGRDSLTVTRCVEIVTEVAEALHAAHEKKIVHRDVKPANILLDHTGKALVADFGIALQDDAVEAARIVGTMSYASPEQLRGEGHLVDRRTDIFSLGVVFYELLTGERPFADNGAPDVRDVEIVPPRRLNPDVPPGIERICLKALAPRATDRYAAAAEMAEELRDCLADCDSKGRLRAPAGSRDYSPRLLPKGLRAFDYEDADFFLELLPGTSLGAGLPDILRYWKKRIEHDGPSFRVGLIHGPSGCGKSSLLRAGLIPRLSRAIRTEYITCTADTTATTLLRRLRQAFPDILNQLDLAGTVSAIRRHLHSVDGPKLLIVLDQFEQWLQHHHGDESAQLVNALRQCDGLHVQCLIAIRDDFWTNVSEFFDELEVELNASDNLKRIDLFSRHHAKKVLVDFGHALAVLPEDSQQLDSEQSEFIEQVISDLAQDDKVAPARLALFTEMMKGCDWNSTNLRLAGGTVGVGVTFLEESFGPSKRFGQYRDYARAVLNRLLPSGSTDIRGDARSYEDLLQASGLEGEPTEFQQLMHILDSELRLVTPVETVPDRDCQRPAQAAVQLTHDFFVPAIRDWLALGRKQTARERAEQRLRERATWWSVRPETSSLPTAREWISIELLARQSEKRKDSKHKGMLKAARRHFLMVGVVLLVVSVLAGVLVLDRQRANHGYTHVAALETSRTADALGIAQRLEPYRRWVDPVLTEVVSDPTADDLHRFHACLALLPTNAKLAPSVARSMLDLPPERLSAADFIRTRDWLSKYCGSHAADVVDVFTHALTGDNREAVRFRAGVALSSFPASAAAVDKLNSPESAAFLARSMVTDATKHPENAAVWSGGLRPVRNNLLEPLERIFRGQVTDADPEMAALFLSKYVSNPTRIVDLVLEAKPSQQHVMLPALKAHRAEALARLKAIVGADYSPATTQDLSLAELKRRAHAAALLCELDVSEHLPKMLDARQDPTEASYLVGYLGRQPNCVPILLRNLQEAQSPAVLAFMLQSLGEIDMAQLSPTEQERCIEVVLRFFATHPHAGVHSSAEWALRRWGEDALLMSRTQHLAGSKPDNRDWYVTQDGQTMIVFRSPIVCRLGSPRTERGRADYELQIERTINHTFTIAATEVTNSQAARFASEIVQEGRDACAWADDADGSWDRCAVGLMTWNRAAQYCVWLSQQEGIPSDQWCYHPRGEAGIEMVPYPDYLQRTGYRLPTEAEWELACRAESITAFSWGADPEYADACAWFGRNSRERNRPVGLKRPNLFGFFDMHGNVAEWLHDRFNYRFDILLPQAGLEKNARIIRGGSVADTATEKLRSAARLGDDPACRASLHLGFRIARTLSHPESEMAAAARR